MTNIAQKFLVAFLTVALAVTMFPLPAFAEEADSVPAEPENGIPLVIINIDEGAEGYGTIEDMNGSKDHSVRCTGTIEIKVPEGYEGEYGSVAVPEGPVDLNFIRGRGNSTWSTDSNTKKPYKIKFKEEQDLFGMGANQEWALMANDSDSTLMKNRIVSWLGGQMGFEYTPQMIPVDVVMIGSSGYSRELGSYCLSELVSRGSNRLEVDKAKLLAIYTDEQNAGDPHFKTDSGIEIKFDDPEKVNEEVIEFVNNLEQMIVNPDTIDENGHDAIAEKMDLTSAADYWWIQEFVCNGDAFGTSSTYMYTAPYAGNTVGKLFWGPLWDFDIAMSLYEEGADTRYGFNNTEMLWLDQLRAKDTQFNDILTARWNGSDGLNQALIELTKSDGKLDNWKSQLQMSWDRNSEIWGSTEYDYEGNEEEVDFDTAVEELRTWIEKRRQWVNENLNRISEVYCTATFMADGNVIATDRVREGGMAYTDVEPPEKDGYLFSHWAESETGENSLDFQIHKDTTFDAVYVREDEAVKPEAVYFARQEDWAKLSEGSYWDNSIKVVPEDAVTPKITWTSSDESVATVSKGGEVTLLSEGIATITVTMFNGVSASYVLHVYDPDQVSPTTMTGIAAQPRDLTLKIGQTKQLGYSILPKGGTFEDWVVIFMGEKSDCVECDLETGVVTGVKPGKTTVTVKLMADNYDTEFADRCVVTVIDPNIAGAEVVLSKTAFTYDGKVHKPVVKTVNGLKLTLGTDYTLSIKNSKGKTVSSPKAAGTYTVYVTGKGDFTGTAKATYKINKAANTLKVKGKTVKIKYKKLKKKARKLKVSKVIKVQKKGQGEKVYKLISAKKGKKSFKKKFKVNKKTGKVTVKKGLKKGTYKVKINVKAKGNANYKASAWKKVTLKIKVK